MHRLVCIGDSIGQGFKSGAVFETNLSFPAIVAWEMGLSDADFRYPTFTGEGGLPINIEYLLRRLDQSFGQDVNWWELPLAIIYLRQWMDAIEDYWERGPGTQPIPYTGPYHNLSIWGFEIQDAYQVSARMAHRIAARPSDDWLSQIPDHAMFRTAVRVLNPSQSRQEEDLMATQVARATQLARNGGIENLLIFLGSNNVLSTVTSLSYTESTDQDMQEADPTKRKATIYTPEHFSQVLARFMTAVEAMNTGGGQVQRVFWGTVPPVTIPPVSRGVGGRMDSAMGLPSPYGDRDDRRWYRRYFRYYTRPWVTDEKFKPIEDDYLTGEQIMKIDYIIAQYKQALVGLVAQHNRRREEQGLPHDWFIVDIHWGLERMAYRRYQEDPSVPPPPMWSPYEMPDALSVLDLDTRFLRAKQGKRITGGIFSLDGVHGTTVGYGLVAQEFINVMQANGVQFFWGDQRTPRVPPITVDFKRLIQLDTLIRVPPYTLDDVWDRLVDGDQVLDMFKRALRAFG